MCCYRQDKHEVYGRKKLRKIFAFPEMRYGIMMTDIIRAEYRMKETFL